MHGSVSLYRGRMKEQIPKHGNSTIRRACARTHTPTLVRPVYFPESSAPKKGFGPPHCIVIVIKPGGMNQTGGMNFKLGTWVPLVYGVVGRSPV